MCQINDHPRKKTCLCHSQKKAGCIELCWAMYQARKDSRESPRDHYSRCPFSRAPAFYDDGPRYLKQDVAYEKHGHAKTVNSIAEAQIKIHFQGRVGNVS